MIEIHQLILSACLGMLGFSLLVPGLLNAPRTGAGRSGLTATFN